MTEATRFLDDSPLIQAIQALSSSALQPTPQTFTDAEKVQISTNLGLPDFSNIAVTLLDTVSDGSGLYTLASPTAAVDGYKSVDVYVEGLFQPKDNVAYQITNAGTKIAFPGPNDTGLRIVVVSALSAVVGITDPTVFMAALVAVASTFPTTAPTGSPGFWLNGDDGFICFGKQG
jgi:hypothetical protein